MPNEMLTEGETLHGHLLVWLAANGIDARRIPVDPHMTLVGDQLTTDQKVQNAAGLDQIDPGADRIARETVTYTITVPPPVDVAAWLLPRCPACGR